MPHVLLFRRVRIFLNSAATADRVFMLLAMLALLRVIDGTFLFLPRCTGGTGFAESPVSGASFRLTTSLFPDRQHNALT